MQARVRRFALAHPADTEAFARAVAEGAVDPRRIVAVIGKTHGNGLVNDYTRGHLTLALSLVLAGPLDLDARAVARRVPFIFSGGVEGVLSPHFTVFEALPDGAPPKAGAKRLALASLFTDPPAPEDIGRQAQIDAVAAGVRAAIDKAGIEQAGDVRLVQVKGPCLAAREIAEAAARGRPAASDNPDTLMALSRMAAALGVAKALGEVPAGDCLEAHLGARRDLFSRVASISSGVEVETNEIVVMGNAAGWSGRLAIAQAPMADALDVQAVHTVLDALGLSARPQLGPADRGRLKAVFVKGEPDRSGRLRGRAHTMLNDGDMNAQRHIRAALGALLAGVTGETELFVSGGAEHQGPDGGGLVAAIAEMPA